jgi:hypothetical protein
MAASHYKEVVTNISMIVFHASQMKCSLLLNKILDILIYTLLFIQNEKR